MMTEVPTVSIVAKNKYRGIFGIPVTGGQRQNESQEAVYKGQNDTRDDIRQPVRFKRKQSTRQNHGHGYFHQDR